MSSNALCPSPANATSNTITMAVTGTVVPTVSVVANATAICPGVLDTFTAIPTSGGSNPSYQWKKNGTNVGVNSAIYTDNTLNNNDAITCVMTSSFSCAVPSTANSNSVVITIKPVPNVVVPSSQFVCNGAGSGIYSFSSSVSGTTYAWTNNITSIGLGASGSGAIASFTGTNAGSAPITATVTVAPTASGCAGTPQNFSVTVNPTATVTLPSNQSVCTGNSSSVVSFGGSIVSGTTYGWTNNNTTTGIGGGAAGNMPSFTVSNTTNSIVTSTITVTPTANSCAGTSQSFTIAVNPNATVNAIPDQTVCNGTSTSPVFFSSPVNGCTFTWTNNLSSIGLPSSGTGNITQFTASNSSSSTVNATITVTASFTGCIGSSQTFAYHIVPANMNLPASQVFCNGASASVPAFTSAISGTTYSWSYSSAGIGLGALGTGNIPSFTAFNSGSAPVTATMEVVPSSNGCTGSPVNFNITVNPSPVVNAVANQPECNGVASPAINFSSATNGSTFAWTNSNTTIGLAASGPGSIASFTPVNATSSPVTASVSVAATANGCTGLSTSFNITVQPSATLSSALSASICTNTLLNYTPSSNYSSASFAWTRAVVAGISNSAGSGTGSISETLINTSSSPVIVHYIYTVSAGGCANPTTFNVAVTVNPNPTITNLSNQNVCGGSSAVADNFNSNVAGSTYSWSNNNTSIGLGASGNGNIASFVTSNTTISPVIATISVVPTANGCAGSTQTFTVTVDPLPSVNAVSNLTLCNGTNTGAINFSGSTVSGTAYNWTNNLTSIGLAATGTGNINSLSAVNATSAPVTATVAVTPVANGCSGAPQSFTVLVNPTPTVNGIGNQTLCNNTATSAITFTGAVAGTTYSWTNNASSIGLAASGSGNIASFTAANTTSSPITATVTVTPGANSCTGSTQSFNITVNPTVSVSASISYNTPSATICAGTSVTNTASVVNGGTSPTYQWYKNSTAVPGATNSSYVTSTLNNGDVINCDVASSVTCPSVTTAVSNSVTFSVNPVPAVNAVSNQVVCNGASTTGVNFSGGVSGTVYNWTNNATSIGLAASGSGNIATFAASNTGSSIVNATITVTPTYTNQGTTCTGTPQSFTITVNPTPTVVLPSNIAVCSGSSIPAITFSGAVSGSNFSWTNNTTSIGLAASGTGNIASFTATNATNASVVATVAVSASANGCTSNPQNLSITVSPVPTVTVPSNQVFCSGTSTTLLSFSGNLSSITYNWANSNTAIGLAGNGSGNIASFTANNSTLSPVTASINVTPTINGCSGSTQSFSITVNPSPVLTSSLSANTICSNTNVNYTPASNIGGTSYSWTRAAITGITPATNNGTVHITELLNNSTANPITVTYAMSLTYNGCTNTYNIAEVVNPSPNLSSSLTPPAICTNTGFSYAPTSATSGTTFNWNRAAVAGISNTAASGTGNPNEVLVNTSSAAVNVIYVYTLSANGCTNTNSVTVPVEIAPSIISSPSAATACAYGTDSFSVSASGSSPSYQWQVNAGSGFSNIVGATSSTLILNGITPSMNGYYYRCIVSNVCSAVATSSSAVLNVNPLPAISSQPTSTGVCASGNASFSVSGTGAGITYQWQVNTGPGFTTVTNGGVYSGATSNQLSITGALASMNGYLYRCVVSGACNPSAISNNATLSIYPNQQPVINSTNPISICDGDSIILRTDTGTGYTYQWKRNGSNISGANDSTYEDQDSGSYTVQVINNNGCTNTSTPVSVTLKPVPAAPVSILLGNTSFCVGDSVVFGTSSVAGLSYQWMHNNVAIAGAVNYSYAANSLGYYEVQVTKNGCSSVSTPQLVVVFPIPQDSLIITGKAIICAGGVYVISAVAISGLSYSWYQNGSLVSGPNSFSTYNAVNPGIYNAYVTTNNGCGAWTQSVNVTSAPSPTPVIMASGNVLNTQAFVTYQWFRYGISIPSAINENYTVSQNGIYTVKVTDSNGCEALSPEYTVSGLGVQNVVITGDDVKIYPNPATSVVHFDAPVKVNVSIFSIEGKTVLQQDDAHVMDISRMANGVYMIRVSDENNILLKTERLVKTSW